MQIPRKSLSQKQEEKDETHLISFEGLKMTIS